MHYRWPLTVRFADVDAAGIVYAPTLLHYCHVAFEDFFEATHGVPYSGWIVERRIGFPSVRVDAAFAAPVRYGDPLELLVTIPRVGRTSVDFHYEGRASAALEVFEVNATKVCIDLDSFEPREIPAELRELFTRYGGAP
ncbi:MAG: acyl-CoA thioesterase [Planctomycetota bacterium]